MDNEFNTKKFASLLLTLNPFEFGVLGSILGYILSIPLSVIEQASLGNFLELVGQMMLTISAQQANIDSQNQKSNQQLQNEIMYLHNEIEKLKKLLYKHTISK